VINYFNRALTRQFDRYSSCCRLPSANDCTSCCSRITTHLQDATTVELAVKQWCATDKL